MDKLEKKALKANIWKYYIIQLCFGLFFATPTMVLFFMDNGLTFTQVLLLQAYFSIAIVLLEVPSGALADWAGKRKAVLWGSSVLILGLIVYGSGRSFTHFLIGESIWAFGLSLISGADSALLFDTLKQLKKEKLYKKIEGRAKSFSLFAAGLAAVAGGFMAHYSLRLPWFLTIMPFAIAAITAYRLVEPKAFTHVEQKGYWDIIAQSVKFVNKHRLIKWYILYSAFLVLMCQLAFWITQPYLKEAGLEIKWFGLAFLFFNLVAAAASFTAHRCEKYLGRRRALISFGIMAVVPFFVLGKYIALWGILLLGVYQVIRGMSSPLFSNYILRYTYSDKRATVLSLKSLGSRVVLAVFYPFFGVLVDAWSISTAFLAGGAIAAAVAVGFFVMYLIIPKKYFKVKRKKFY
ncbi:MAG: MFS transporter [Candidatus Woesearchaeota archaeon]